MTKGNVGFYNIWKKYKNDAKYFIETGTGPSAHLVESSIQTANYVGFERYYSVDIYESCYNNASNFFKDRLGTDVFLHCGDSVRWLEELLPTIDNKCLFLLDAHHGHAPRKAPAFKELEVISKHHIKNHIICIDDMPIYYGESEICGHSRLNVDSDYRWGIGNSSLKQSCLSINPDYKFDWSPPDHMPGIPKYVLIAYVGEEND
jgi:hypothetical protein